MPVFGNNSTIIPVNIKTSSYTIDRQDGGEEIKFEITANATATLPVILDNQIGDGFNIFIRNSTTGTDTVTIEASGSDTIDGVTTLDKDEVIWLRGFGTEWQSMDQYADGAVTSVATGAGLTGGPITSTGTISIDDAGVTTAKIANDAVDGSKIAMGSDAQGDILYHNGTDYVRLAAGTSGQFLKSNGSGANPQWVDAASGGGWEFVSASTASSSATVAFTGFVSGYDYKVVFASVLPATDGVAFQAQLGISGPTYRTSGYKGLAGGTTSAAGTVSSDNWSNNIHMSGTTCGSATDEYLQGEITILDPTAATDTNVFGTLNFAQTSGNRIVGTFGGIHTTAEAMDAIKFYFYSGNISSGEFTLYRMANS